MTEKDSPPRLPAPSVPVSEPEQEHRVIESLADLMTDDEARRVIGLECIRDTLIEAGLDVDDNGFIVRKDTGEYATPYAYDPDAFQEIPSPVDDPLDAYFSPEEDVSLCILSKGRMHLTDLHTINYVDGEPRPVRDDKMMLQQMMGEIGFAFNTVTQWSDALDLVDQDMVPGPNIHLNHPALSEHTLTLTCIRCEFTGEPSEWDGEEDAPECPECGGPWDTRGLEICTACQTTHWWEDLDHSGGMYGEPTCPDCDAGVQHLESQTHYDLF